MINRINVIFLLFFLIFNLFGDTLTESVENYETTKVSHNKINNSMEIIPQELTGSAAAKVLFEYIYPEQDYFSLTTYYPVNNAESLGVYKYSLPTDENNRVFNVEYDGMYGDYHIFEIFSECYYYDSYNRTYSHSNYISAYAVNTLSKKVVPQRWDDENGLPVYNEEYNDILNSESDSAGFDENWQTAYIQFINEHLISNSNQQSYYALKDMDNDGTPELIIRQSIKYQSADAILSVYTYSDGVSKIGDYNQNGAGGLFTSDNPKYPGLFHNTWGGGIENYWYLSIKDGALVCDHVRRINRSDIDPGTADLSEDKELVAEAVNAFESEKFPDNLLDIYPAYTGNLILESLVESDSDQYSKHIYVSATENMPALTFELVGKRESGEYQTIYYYPYKLRIKNDQATIQEIEFDQADFAPCSSDTFDFEYGDFRFDGYGGFKLASTSSGHNPSYYVWTWDNEKNCFSRFPDLEKVGFIRFDYNDQLITIVNRGSATYHEFDTYEYINDKLTLIKKVIDADSDGYRKVYELRNGQLKLIETTESQLKGEYR